MRTLITLLLFSAAYVSLPAQKLFTLKSSIGLMSVKVNGQVYSVDSLGTRIPTRYPSFDKLAFLAESPGAGEAILCNFKPDSSYSVTFACCGSLDLVPSHKLEADSLKHWDYEMDFDKIQAWLMDKPFFSIRTKKTPKDSVYAWHADAACQTESHFITTKPWAMGVPPKCFYWNNITTILFYRTDYQMPAHDPTDLEKFLGVANIVTITSISFRLFDDERFMLILDEKKKEVLLRYE